MWFLPGDDLARVPGPKAKARAASYARETAIQESLPNRDHRVSREAKFSPKTTSCCGVNAALFGPSALSIGERMMPSSVHVEATLLGSVRCARGRLRQAASALRRLLP